MYVHKHSNSFQGCECKATFFDMHTCSRIGDFSTEAARDEALDSLDNTSVDGCRIRVKVLVSLGLNGMVRTAVLVDLL
jgi:hypothetical protein